MPKGLPEPQPTDSNPEWWRSRIVGHGEELVSQIIFNPANWKKHPKDQLQAIAGSIQELGYFRSGTMNRRTGNLVDGHARALVLDYHGIERMPMEYIDVSPEEESAILLLIDPLASLAVADKPKLEALLHDVHLMHEDLVKAVARIAEDEGLKYGEEEAPKPPEEKSEEEAQKPEEHGVVVVCHGYAHQVEVFESLEAQGFECRQVMLGDMVLKKMAASKKGRA